MLKKIAFYFFILSNVIAFKTDASIPEPPTEPRDYVIDLANIINDDIKSQLNVTLQNFERQTTAQMLVLTVQSLDGQSVEEFAFNTKENWKLGQKGKDNGVLLVIALKEKKYRIEVGYGLESVLPDSLLGEIGRENLVPYFKKGDYSTGIYNAVQTIIRRVSGNNDSIVLDKSKIQFPHMLDESKFQYFNRNHEIWSSIGTAFLVLGSIVLLIFALRLCPVDTKRLKRKKHKDMWIRDDYSGYGLASYGNSGYGSDGFGGGFGGFGGGSFGGGGGGSGGGGGASGGW